jgi:hypothetical protein
MDEVDRLLAQAKQDALGWMPVPVYRRIHDTAAAAGGGTFVEIGTSNGAATIALALGGKAGGKAFRILTVDRFQAGKGIPGATVSERAQSVRRRFERFGVVDSIEIVAGTAADLVERHDPRAIGLLLLDTDGRIERELALLYDRLAPAGGSGRDPRPDRLVRERRSRASACRDRETRAPGVSRAHPGQPGCRRVRFPARPGPRDRQADPGPRPGMATFLPGTAGLMIFR